MKNLRAVAALRLIIILTQRTKKAIIEVIGKGTKNSNRGHRQMENQTVSLSHVFIYYAGFARAGIVFLCLG